MWEAHTWEENVLFICKHEAEPTQLPETCGSPSPGESGFVQCNLRPWHKVTRHTLWNPWYPIYTWSTANWSRLKLRYQRRWGQSRVKNKSLGDSIILTRTQTSDIPIKGAVCGRETFTVTLMPCCSSRFRLSGFGNKHNKPGEWAGEYEQPHRKLCQINSPLVTPAHDCCVYTGELLIYQSMAVMASAILRIHLLFSYWCSSQRLHLKDPHVPIAHPPLSERIETHN